MPAECVERANRAAPTRARATRAGDCRFSFLATAGKGDRATIVKITYYLDVISSWCYWAEPTWAELRRRYAGRAAFLWKLALLDASGLPPTREHELWFYRRSGMVMRSPFMLDPDWFEPGIRECLAPNLTAEAAKDFGVADDRVRLALAEAALRKGRKVLQWEDSIAVAAEAAGLDAAALRMRAQSPEAESRARASTAEFHALQVTQRPTFVIDDAIGDRAVFSGLVQLAPLVATIEAMFSDVAAYAAHEAHFGPPPK
jgi:predicted DsbA family dithiol-disulfide isomerase